MQAAVSSVRKSGHFGEISHPRSRFLRKLQWNKAIKTSMDTNNYINFLREAMENVRIPPPPLIRDKIEIEAVKIIVNPEGK